MAEQKDFFGDLPKLVCAMAVMIVMAIVPPM
jgi:hypothetical protein